MSEKLGKGQGQWSLYVEEVQGWVPIEAYHLAFSGMFKTDSGLCSLHASFSADCIVSDLL